MMFHKKIIMLIFLGILIVGCSDPADKYIQGEVMLSEDFSNANAWERFTPEDGRFRLEVVDGAYQIDTGSDGFIWGLNEQNHSDVVMEVTTSQISTYENNAYGIMCRSDTSNNGDGYYFLISGDGYYSIARGEGDDVTPLVDWSQSSAVNEGSDNNTMRAICLGSTLIFYVNDRLVAETQDETYQSGYAGFVATAFDGGEITVRFDDMTIWQASAPAE